jgi:hypothetical protein
VHLATRCRGFAANASSPSFFHSLRATFFCFTMADDSEISAFEASVNARINESAAALSEWLRPAEAAAHRCVADALDDRSLTTAAALAKGDACTARVSGARARFADEMQGFQRKLHACHGDTASARGGRRRRRVAAAADAAGRSSAVVGAPRPLRRRSATSFLRARRAACVVCASAPPRRRARARRRGRRHAWRRRVTEGLAWW